MNRIARLLPLSLSLAIAGCASPPPAPPAAQPEAVAAPPPSDSIEQRLQIYAPVDLAVDLSGLSLNQVEIVRLLIRASRVMDELFWEQTWGDREALLATLDDPAMRRLVEINYGPWDRLDGDKPLVAGIGPRPPGARFYPEDMSREEFEAWTEPAKTELYTLVRRDPLGRLYTVPYHQAWHDPLGVAARMLARAAELTANEAFRRYLTLRARALITDDYHASDLAWMDMRDNDLDIVIGPIGTYEDRLFGYKAAFEAYVLLKDWEWSARLARFSVFLPQLQQALPVSEAFKAETPGMDSELNAYDVLYYAGHSNAGRKTIAINLPNDERVQLKKGSRRLQLKNAMRAKFDAIMVPIAEELIVAEQLRHVRFDAFFGNTMFHEVAHGLGVRQTINGRGTVREALREYAASMEENKADVLGLWMIGWLHDRGELPEVPLMDYYVTFLAGIFRSVRFGASSAHGRANMVRFNFFRDWGAFHRDPESGRYRADADGMRAAIEALAAQILTLQGSGDYPGAVELTESLGVVGPGLQADLERLARLGIPVDVVFRQGEEQLGL